MRIKKLELCGFKSFKDRTVIQFDGGVTGIVGPNGCGKSNIVDALVWVMGETSAKHLRGASMEDVIFAGSQEYAPLGMAEVSLVLENDGGPFPVSYLNHSELMMTRRLHRTGESEYLINKQPARLKDIQEIFMDTGAGSRGFSIVEQGQIEKIITSKPHERRTLIEEAAGITKFKARKRESERKLKSTDQNLIRLADIVSELKRQMNSLERQAERAERYKKFKDHITDKEMWLFSIQYKDLSQQLKNIQQQFIEAQNRYAGFDVHEQSLQSNWENLKTSLEEKRVEIEDIQNKLQQTQRKASELEKSIRESQFEVKQAQQSQKMTKDFIGQHEVRKKALETEIYSIQNQFEEFESLVEEVQKVFEASQSQFEKAQAQINEIDRALSDKSRRLITLEQSAVEIKAKKESLKDKEEELKQDKEQTEDLCKTIFQNQKKFQKRKDELKGQLESKRQFQLGLNNDLEALKENMRVQKEKYTQTESQHHTVKEELSQAKSLLYSLENLQKNKAGYKEGVRFLISKKSHSELKTLADVVDVPEEWEVAFAHAVGVKLQTFVAPHFSISWCENIFLELKSQNQGRVSFFQAPELLDIRPLPSQNFFSFPLESLYEKVVVHGSYDNLLKPFLSQIFLIHSSSQAKEILKKAPQALCVTKEGEVFDSLGFISGGSSESSEALIVRRKREIRDLADKKDRTESSYKKLTLDLKILKDRVLVLESEWEQAKEKNTSEEIQRAHLQKDLEQTEHELGNTEKELSKQEDSLKEIAFKWDQISQDLKILIEKEEEESRLMESLRSDKEILQHNLIQAQNGLEALRKKATDSQIQYAAKSEKLESMKENQEKLQSTLDEVHQEITHMTSKSQESEHIILKNQQAIEKQKLELQNYLDIIQKNEREISSLKNEFEDISMSERQATQKVSDIHLEKSQVQSKLKECELQKEQIQIKIQFLKEQAQEKYLENLEVVSSKYVDKFVLEDQKSIEDEVKDLRSKLSRIGDVNLSAIQEYKDISKRHTFLYEQQQDLLKSKEQLKKVINRIQRICSRRFVETFESVNERFKKVFPILFGGGEARLVLVENEDETFDPGIDIVSQPPGKKMQNVSLLSGGEKALTAVSLIFSIFLVKPSPFCLLDEVDAPLDDANVFRFNDLVKEMAKRSQIILVTHNKNTMAVNNKLYGVTMQEKGISKMASVNLENEALISA